MKNLLLLLLLANILYFIWGLATDKPPEAGVTIVDTSTIGPSFELSSTQPATSVGAMLAAGPSSNLAAVVGRSCVSIGPFAKSPDAERAYQEYEKEGMRADVRSTRGQLFVGHWVQVPDIPDVETGNAMVKKLVAGGLTDAYLLPGDDEKYKVSLGLFGDVSRAERIELQAESLNLPVEITPQMRDATVFFVDIALPPGQGASAMVERYGEDKVLLREAASCPTTG